MVRHSSETRVVKTAFLWKRMLQMLVEEGWLGAQMHMCACI